MSDHNAHDSHHKTSPDGKHHSHTGTYITVFLILTFLTIVELFIPSVYNGPDRQNLKMLLLVGMALSKAWFVAMFFMHLNEEKPWLKGIALMPAYMGVFAVLLMLESHYRTFHG